MINQTQIDQLSNCQFNALRPILVLIRGLPGSGKSTLARHLAKTYALHHCETDQYFEDQHGRYHFDVSKLSQAHAWCQAEVERLLLAGHCVVVSNTCVRLWEIEPYRKLAKAMGVSIMFIECKATFPSIHDVPKQTMLKMRRNWQQLPVSWQ
ncbi:AAA family ATPase [Vibrio gallicus]|uniref:AAA family ATPase n=1 Tax=Vibrio gallicus TaxID=190897 RepID=UPI0021C257A5|nr:AAA family ATPase [Vibrio gallicus]